MNSTTPDDQERNAIRAIHYLAISNAWRWIHAFVLYFTHQTDQSPDGSTFVKTFRRMSVSGDDKVVDSYTTSDCRTIEQALSYEILNRCLSHVMDITWDELYLVTESLVNNRDAMHCVKCKYLNVYGYVKCAVHPDQPSDCQDYEAQ